MFSFVLLAIFCSNIHRADSKFHPNRIFKPGDVTLGGLFDVHIKGPNDTCSSELFTMGLGHVEAMLFAIERINDDSSILPNVTIGYDIRDYCENAGMAMTMAYDMVRSTDPFCQSGKNRTNDLSSHPPVVAIIGPHDSISAVLVGGLLQVNGIAAISPSATSHELSSKMYRNFFRTVPCDTWQAKVMADIIEYFNWTYVATIALDDTYGRQGVWAVEKEVYKRRTFCIAYSEFLPRLDYTEKLSQIVFKLKQQRNIGVVIVWLSGGYGRAFLQETNKQGVRDRTWIFSDAITAEESVHLDPRFTGLEGSLGIQPRDYRDKAFDDHLRTMTRARTLKSNLTWWKEFWAQHCNRKLSECTKNMSLYQSIKKIRSSFVPYLLDAVYAVAHAIDKMYKCVEPNGLLPGGECPRVSPSIDTKSLPLYLQKVSFDGVTGRVQFDESGDVQTASYDIVNFQRGDLPGRRYKKVLVGSWRKNAKPQLSLESNVLWNANLNGSMPRSVCVEECPPGTRMSPTTPCCWECIKCQQNSISTRHGSHNCTECSQRQRSNKERTKCTELPIISMQLNSISGILITVFASFGLILALFTWGIFIRHFNTPIAKASNREMSLILLAGVTSLFVLSLLNLPEPTNMICRFSHCGRMTIWILCVSVLLVKTIRIASAFQGDIIAQNVKPFIAKASTQRALLASLTAVQMSLTIALLTLGPPYKETTITYLKHISIICKAYSSHAAENIVFVNITYGFVLSLSCTYYAYKVRNIPENFNEAKRIGFAMYILLLSALAYYPVAFALDGWHITVLECATNITSALGFLLCIFAPRIYIILFKPGQNTLVVSRAQVASYSFATTTYRGALTKGGKLANNSKKL